jgi:hypothetical protein
MLSARANLRPLESELTENDIDDKVCQAVASCRPQCSGEGMTDWTQKLKAIEAKAEDERRAQEAQIASDHADYVARMSAINHVLQDIVSPALDELKNALIGHAYIAEIERSRDQSGTWTVAIAFRIQNARAKEIGAKDAPTSEFRIQDVSHKRQLLFSTNYPEHTPRGANEHVDYHQITPGWLEDKLSTFVENALSSRT